MTVTVYTFVTAIVFFNAFAVLLYVLRKKLNVYIGFNFYPLLVIVAATLVRLLVPIETPLTFNVNVPAFLPEVQRFLLADGYLPMPRFMLGVIAVNFILML